MADDEPSAARGEGGIEVFEALEQELGARSRGMPPVKQAVVEAEDRDDVVVAVKCRPQRRMIVDAQIPSVPD